MAVVKEFHPDILLSSGLFRRKKTNTRSSVDNFHGYHYVRRQSLFPSRTYFIIAVGTSILVLVAVGIVHISSAISVPTTLKPLELGDPEVPLPPSPSILRRFNKGAVCSDSSACSDIGREILRQNGSAVDATIATLFCNGMVNCQSMGLGGGFIMTIYDRQEQRAHTLNAREMAPAAATQEMFRDEPRLAQMGALAVGVPGELAGYWEAHQRFGRLPWSSLIDPTLKLCHEGYNMSKHQFDSLNFRPQNIFNDELLKHLFVNPVTGKFYRQGSRIVQHQYCKTLRIVSEGGGHVFYNGSLARMLVEDIQQLRGIITLQDLQNYRVRWDSPVSTKLHDGDTLYSVAPPGSGVILSMILNVLDGYKFNKTSVATVNNTVLTFHRIVEAFKYAFAKRTELGDSEFVDVKELVTNITSKWYGDAIRQRISKDPTKKDPSYYGAVFYNQEDHGTSHVSVISPDGDAVSVTSTVNLYFGAGITSKQTGIILNSGMDDFSSPYFKNNFDVPGSPANRLVPGKRPFSSMCPSIIVNSQGDVRLVIGAAGGTKITTAVAYVIIRHLWFEEDIKKAVDASRIHHQLYPMEISYEYGILKQVVSGLQSLGHKVNQTRSAGSIICAMAKINNTIFANADYRKGGDVFGL